MLRKLIIGFGDSFADAVATLRGQIANGALGEARRLAHTLKGVAGSLEIGAVASAAADMEAAIADNALQDVNNLLDALERVIAPALLAAGSLTSAAAAVPQTAPATDISAVIGPIEELRAALTRRSLGARAAFERLALALGLNAHNAQSHPLKTAIDTLDYDGALRQLDDLADAYSTQSEEVLL